MRPLRQFHKNDDRGQRPSFTLIELLVVIAIIGAMAGMVLFALNGARQDAMRTRTRGTIEKINAVILERWESYRYRSVQLNISRDLTRRDPDTGNVAIPARDVAKIRMVMLRDLMRMEMPDSITDMLYPPTNNIRSTRNQGTYNLDAIGGGRPVSGQFNILRQYFGLPPFSDTYTGPVQELPARPADEDEPTGFAWLDNHEFAAAECLYAIVAHSSFGGGSALENFGTSEIGDVDGDGFPEFIDAWGEPISWIRWPAGSDSRLNLSYRLMGSDGSPASPDAFDPLRTDALWNDASVDQKPWTLVPLVFSKGPDREFGIDGVSSPRPTSGNLAEQLFQVGPPHTIFIRYPESHPLAGEFIAGRTIDRRLATDNISNHDILLE